MVEGPFFTMRLPEGWRFQITAAGDLLLADTTTPGATDARAHDRVPRDRPRHRTLAVPPLRPGPGPGGGQLQDGNAGPRPRPAGDPPAADRPGQLRVHVRARPGVVPDPGVLLPRLRHAGRDGVPAARPPADVRHADRCRRAEGAVGQAPGGHRDPAGPGRPRRHRPPAALEGARHETHLRRHRRHVHRLLLRLGRRLHPGQGAHHAPQPVPGLQRGPGPGVRHAGAGAPRGAHPDRLGAVRDHAGHQRADRAQGPPGRRDRNRGFRGDHPAVARPRLRRGPGRARAQRPVQRHPARPAGAADPDPPGTGAGRLRRPGADGPGRGATSGGSCANWSTPARRRWWCA